MVQFTQIDATPRDDSLEAAISTRLGDLDSGKYRRNNAFVLRQFAEFIRHEEDATEVREITAGTLRKYARVLREATTEEDTITASTAEQYWAIVSAFLSWSVREELLEKNPAQLTRASEPLPDSDEETNRQFWSERERDAVCATADKVVDDLLEDNHTQREKRTAFRDRALVYTLAYTGCRGAELASVSADEKRNGVRWADVNLEEGIISVYGKTRTRQDSPIFEPAIDPLERWQNVVEPLDEWPVFPSGHLPSLYACLPEDVQGNQEAIWKQLREYDCTPPAVSTEGVRRILTELCAQSDYEFDEPLKPHGARRGLGDALYQEQAELAQETLRHQNIKTTHESYREERTRQIKERGDELF